MDAKGRFSLPARYREQFEEQCRGRVIVTADPDYRSLLLYPYPEYEALEAEIRKLPNQNPRVRRLQRLFMGYALELELDANGRLLLNAGLRSYADLEKKLVLLGQGNKVEIWSEPVWEEQLQQDDAGTEGADVLASVSL